VNAGWLCGSRSRDAAEADVAHTRVHHLWPAPTTGSRKNAATRSGPILSISARSSPADLEGKTVGVIGVPSDTAVFETMVEEAGGDPGKSKVVTVGSGGIQALIAGRVSAFTGYLPATVGGMTSGSSIRVSTAERPRNDFIARK
jgi:hypothetical protein